MSIFETRRQQHALRDVARTRARVQVVRAGSTVEMDSLDLVPNDVLALPVCAADKLLMTCDAVLVSGRCVVDESMLTGESVPVNKNALPMHDPQAVRADKRNTLFSGTYVIQVRPAPGHQHALAVVVRTGFGTSKGGLVRSILYPKVRAGRPADASLHRCRNQH